MGENVFSRPSDHVDFQTASVQCEIASKNLAIFGSQLISGYATFSSCTSITLHSAIRKKVMRKKTGASSAREPGVESLATIKTFCSHEYSGCILFSCTHIAGSYGLVKGL